MATLPLRRPSSRREYKTRNFSETKYFLKIDTPQLYDKAKIRFVPNGEWLCMLFYSKGKGLSENLGFYLDTLEKEKISVSVIYLSWMW